MNLQNYLVFSEREDSLCQNDLKQESKNLNLLELSFDLFKAIPRLFTITTKNGSYQFNIEMLTDTSQAITDHLSLHPDQPHFHIDIDDDENIMSKFEQMYLGKVVVFNDSEIPLICKITNILNISNIPDNLKQASERHYYGRYRSFGKKNNGIQLSKSSLELFLRNQVPNNFLIITNNREYHCNKFGVYSSLILRNLLQQNPSMNEYFYNFDNEFNEFDLIFNLFNFKSIQITSNNMNSLKKIAEDFQIECILNEIDDFIKSYENSAKTIEEKHVIIDEANQLFHLLYKIKDLSVKTVSNSIIESAFSKSEEDVKELAAFILQVVHSDLSLHTYLIELLILLNEASNEDNFLNLLLPFFTKQLMQTFAKNKYGCSFVYLLCKKGIISKEQIVNKIMSVDKFWSKTVVYDKFDRSYHNNAVVWFFPELIEIKQITKESLFCNLDKNESSFIRLYYPNNIDAFKKMRDSGQPDNEIAKAIINDDVDALQSIISKDMNITSKVLGLIPFNLFESFINFENATYLNYSAFHGSIKCLKYLLLNHAVVDKSTLGYAIYGGNSEIIRIIDQHQNAQLADIVFDDSNQSYNLFWSVSFAVIKHRNDLLDWFLEQKFAGQGLAGNCLSKLVTFSVENGNIHSLIECIDTGLDLNSLGKDFIEKVLQTSSERGFARLTEFLFSLLKLENNPEHELFFVRQLDCSVSFGNLSIFKLFLSIRGNQSDLEKPLLIAIEKDYISIIKYIVETLFKDQIHLSRGGILRALGQSIKKNSTDLFTYLITQLKFDKIMKKFEISIFDFINFLLEGCSAGNFEAVKVITDLILEKDSKVDFTEPFIRASESKSFEICHFFVEKNVFLNFLQLCKEASRIAVGDEKIFKLLLSIADSEMRDVFLGSFLYESIRNKNKSLVEFILNEDVSYDCALFEAVRAHDVEIVDVILKHDSKPSFINRISKDGTALNIAVCSSDLVIVRRLLSLPGIDPSLCDKKGKTPLLSVIENGLNVEILNDLLNFYGDKIQSQSWQIYEALKIILKKLSTMDDRGIGGFVFGSHNRIDKSDECDNIYKIVNRFLQLKTIDFNHPINKHTLLTFACEVNEIELVKILMKSDRVDVNSYETEKGNTPLMIAVNNKNSKIIEYLIGFPQTDINLRNFYQQTALTIAVHKKLEDVVSLLISNEKFDQEESRLNYAFFISSDQISKQLISIDGLNVNYKLDKVVKSYQSSQNSDDMDDYIFNHSRIYAKKKSDSVPLFETTLTHAVSTNNVEMVDMIINHPTFDPIQSQLKTAIFTSAQKNNGEIFKKLLKLIGNDVNICSQNGESLLVSSVVSESQEIVTRIVNHSNFNSFKSDICKAFNLASFIDEDAPVAEKSEANINIMRIICDYDAQHDRLIAFDRLLSSGKSFFTSIDGSLSNVDKLVTFFVDAGVDVNVADDNGISPLEYAIGISSRPFVSALLSSKRIDFSKRFGSENKTYLHLAARSGDPKILTDFLELNVIDVNSIDHQGETPLMEACRFNRANNVKQLFLMDDLDFLYCNHVGEDAVRIALKCSNRMYTRKGGRNDDQVRTREEYMARLLEIISDTISNFR